MVGLAGAAQAATADGVGLRVTGEVLVNQGQGFRPATSGVVLHPGDRILVPLNGQAGLTYSGGCGVVLGGGSLATISNVTPCQGGSHNAGIITSGGGLTSNARFASPNAGPIKILHGVGGGGQTLSP
jgi:hypothetical protein